MSRYLFALWPFTGHVRPQLSIAAALRERGHEVALYTGESVRPSAESLGCELFAFDRVDEASVTEAVRALEVGAGTGRAGRASIGEVQRCFRRWLVDSIPGQVADLSQVIESWQPDVLVSDQAMWAPVVILADTSGVPVAVWTFLGPPAGGPDVPPPGLGLPSPRRPAARAAAWAASQATDVLARGLRRRVDELRAGHGLGPMGCSVNAFMARMPLTIVISVRELDYNRREIPPGVRYVGRCALPGPAADGSGPPWLDALPGERPWVHVSAPAMPGADPFLLRAAVRGLAQRPIELIVGTGGLPAPGELGADALPANAHLAEWVDHDALLPRCAALVTSGGAGTIMAALAAGVPLVVVPTTWDKPDNARRVVEAGVGVRLAPRRCTPERLGEAVQRVLTDPRYRANARRFASLIAQAPGARGAAEALEALSSRHVTTTNARGGVR